MAFAFSGGLVAPRIMVFLLRTHQSQGAMNAPCHIPAFGIARGLLVRVVVVARPRVGKRPSARHHPFLDVLAVDLASRHQPAAAVGGRA